MPAAQREALVSLHLEDDQMCYGCGKKNTRGFRLDFQHEKGRLRAEVIFKKEHQGFKDIVHGGMVGLLLDEMMVNLVWKEGIPAVSAELTVRLKKPTRIGEKVLLEGRLEREEKRMVYTTAVAKNTSGDVLATASAVCVKIPRQANFLERPAK